MNVGAVREPPSRSAGTGGVYQRYVEVTSTAQLGDLAIWRFGDSPAQAIIQRFLMSWRFNKLIYNTYDFIKIAMKQILGDFTQHFTGRLRPGFFV